MSSVAEKVVAITGASSGIGEATALRLAAGGARLVLGARRTGRLKELVDEIEAAGGTACFAALDVVDRADVDDFSAFALKKFGRIDVLVNNAGIMPLSLLAALRVDDWDRMIDVNIRGVLHGIAAVLPIMEAQGSGHVINVASVVGYAVPPSAAVYAATKFAVRAISEGLRKETDKIRVTVVSPGGTSTELRDSITDENVRAALAKQPPVAIRPDAVAQAIAYAIEQPPDVDVSEIVVRHIASQL